MTKDKPAWRTMAVRFTAFWTSPDLVSRIDQSSILKAVYEIEPDSIEIKKGDVFRQESAALGAGKVLFSVSDGRVDIVWRVEDLSGDVGLGDSISALDVFVSKAAQWLSGSKNVIRVALGVAYNVRVDSVESANRIISESLDFIKLPSNSVTDLVFQINYPSRHVIDGETINFNRLEKWSSQRVEEFVFKVPGTQPVGYGASSNSVNLAFLELDLNTDASRSTPCSAVVIREAYKYFLEEAANYFK